MCFHACLRVKVFIYADTNLGKSLYAYEYARKHTSKPMHVNMQERTGICMSYPMFS